jgi:hypothetical protein
VIPKTKNHVISSPPAHILGAMRGQIMALVVVVVAAANPSLTFASGSVTTSAASHQFTRVNVNNAQATTSSPVRSVIVQEPYDLGKALFSGKYKFGKPKLSAANIAEKKQRLFTLQRALPAMEREKINSSELSGQLTDREMNAIEYYLGMRFGKFITKPPSWANEEPPPKIAYAK